MNRVEAYHLLHKGTLALARAEQNGIRVDMDYVKRKQSHLDRKIDRYNRLFKESKFFLDWKKSIGKDPNPNSSVQLANYLYKVKGLKPPKLTASGNGSTDKEALAALKITELEYLQESKRQKKMRDYLDGFEREQVQGWIHPFFNLHLVKTFRSCVAKGTKVLVVRDFEKHPNGVPIESVCKGDHVYCFDEKLRPAIRKVLWAGKTGHREIVRVHYSVVGSAKGYLDVTPEHKIRLIDGTYEQAQNLVGDFRKEGDSKYLPKIRALSCSRADDKLKFSGWLRNGKGILESHIVYEHFNGNISEGDIIHHIDHNHYNHAPENLEKTQLSPHSVYHSLHISDELKQKQIEVLKTNRHKIQYSTGWDNPQSLKLSKFTCLRLLATAKGKLTKVPYDFTTFKKYLKYHDIDHKSVRIRYNYKGLFISKGLLQKIQSKGRAEVQKSLHINYYTLKKLYTYYGLDTNRKWGNQFGNFAPGNHTITKIEWIKKKVDVYDIEVEGVHNFFANEICVHNSSDKPNFQNIPKRDKEAMKVTRKALYPRHGHQLMEVDYSGLEVRIAACYHKDPTMLKYIRTGYDMHSDMAKQIYLLGEYDGDNPEHGFLRGSAKNGFVFPQFYGDYFKNCAENMACQWCELPTGRWKEGQGVPFNGAHISDHMLSAGFKSLDGFTKHLERIEKDFWENRFPHYARWKERWWRQYQKTGYVDFLTGFRCKGVMGKNDAINYPIQGAAFHCLLWSFIQLDEFLYRNGFKSRIIGQIHDSIVLDVHPSELDKLVPIIRKITCEDLPKYFTWINVPLDVDFEICGVDESWADKKNMKIQA